MPWQPDRYHLFQADRFAPFEDLFALINPRPKMRVIDLGCGTGELTRRLADRLPESEVFGIDSSPEMLSRARGQEREGLRFEKGTIEETKGEWDLIFSHAALHWVDDHRALVQRLFAMLSEGGQLAVQVPSNHAHPAHRLIVEISSDEPFRTALGGWTRESPVLSISDYASALYDSGGKDITVFEKVYPSLLENSDEMAEWTAGSTLVPYFERLPKESHDGFLKEYRRRLKEIFPSTPVLYTFRRTLFAATSDRLSALPSGSNCFE